MIWSGEIGPFLFMPPVLLLSHLSKEIEFKFSPLSITGFAQVPIKSTSWSTSSKLSQETTDPQ
jgi:hypothetical protein